MYGEVPFAGVAVAVPIFDAHALEQKREHELDQLHIHNIEDAVEQQPQVAKKARDHVGRNDECPCGSGKKFKKCHGR